MFRIGGMTWALQGPRQQHTFSPPKQQDGWSYRCTSSMRHASPGQAITQPSTIPHTHPWGSRVQECAA